MLAVAEVFSPMNILLAISWYQRMFIGENTPTTTDNAATIDASTNCAQSQ
jgi:hypothetical protein